MPPTRPNILFLFSDQHRADALGCADHPHVRTPHLDRLAAGGTRFASCYCATPLCMPSRAAMATGRWPHNLGIVTNSQGYMRTDEPMISHAFKEAGYHTSFIGKLHLCQHYDAGSEACAQWLEEAGWDVAIPHHGKAWTPILPPTDTYNQYLLEKGLHERFAQDYKERCFSWKFPGVEGKPPGYAAPSVLSEEDHHDAFISRQCLDWLDDIDDPRQPWFCWLNWGGPHDPWDAPGRFGDMYDPQEMEPPLHDDLESAPQFLRDWSQKYTSGHGPDTWRAIKAQYFGSITMIDHWIGRILEALEQRGELDNTLIVYASDHGEMLCDHRMLTKWVMYEASVTVPLIVHWPAALAGGRVVTTPVSLLDLIPTLFDLAGFEAECLPVQHGTSLAPLLRGEEQALPDAVFSEMNAMKMLRVGPWKYVTRPDWEVDQLFNLDDDPDELVNLATRPEHAERIRAFRDRLLTWLIETQEAPAPINHQEPQ